jgi:isoleucyl-tRNA synthetase
VDECYNDYEPTKATRLITDFVTEHLSNWYVRLGRRRFWKGEMDQDKQDAYDSLYTVLVTMCEAAAPLLPFTTEYVWKGLVGEK